MYYTLCSQFSCIIVIVFMWRDEWAVVFNLDAEFFVKKWYYFDKIHHIVVIVAMKLVIVESPSKCGKINKYIGKEYIVRASLGHIRDLSPKSLAVDI